MKKVIFKNGSFESHEILNSSFAFQIVFYEYRRSYIYRIHYVLLSFILNRN